MNGLLEILDAVVGLVQANPVLLLFCVVPFALLAHSRQIFPSTLFVAWVGVACLLTFGLLLKQDILPFMLSVDAAIALVAAYDVFTFPGPRRFAVERSCQRIASLRKRHRVSLVISNLSNRSQSILVKDDVPQEFDPTPSEFRLMLRPASRAVLHYEMKASRRGAFDMQCVHLQVRSQLGLWRRMISLPAISTLHVYPDMQQLREYAHLARTNRLSLMGVRRTRQIGQDNEFERLRDYTRDDNFKHIDWRSTARRNKLTVKDFQTNQSQRLIFMIDCGRMMTNEASGISLLDHAFNSMLMLSYVALERGDSVGLITFSDRIHSSIPPASGSRQMNQLLHASFDRFPNLVESRYEEAFLHLSTRYRKRALVILITNVIDEVNAQQVQRHLRKLSGRHLPLGVLLRDERLFSIAESDRLHGSLLFRSAAAAQILTWRHQVITDLQHQGVLVLDTAPHELTAPLVNQYLEIKARHLL